MVGWFRRDFVVVVFFDDEFFFNGENDESKGDTTKMCGYLIASLMKAMFECKVVSAF